MVLEAGNYAIQLIYIKWQQIRIKLFRYQHQLHF